jgi:hypothetical protein
LIDMKIKISESPHYISLSNLHLDNKAYYWFDDLYPLFKPSFVQ